MPVKNALRSLATLLIRTSQNGMLSTGEREVLRWSIAARLLTVLLAFVTSLVVSPFDTSGRLALATAPESYDNSSNSDVISKLALPFTQWDTIHFLAIARDGYADEQKFAFLPGMPGLLAVSGRLPYYLGLSERVFSPAIAVLSVSLLALSLSCFTPVLLYRSVYCLCWTQ